MNAIIGIRNAVRKAVSGIIVAIRGYGDEYDADGHIIHSKGASGFERWYEYDSNGNRIHEKSSTGYEWWDEANGKLVHVKFADGSEEWYEYDTNGTLIHMNDSEGFEWKCSRKEITK